MDKDYVKKTITVPKDLNDRLCRETNASAVIVEAVEAYYANKQAVRELAGHALALGPHLQKLISILGGDSSATSLKDMVKQSGKGEDPCCANKQPCKHWKWIPERESWVNQLSGRARVD